VESSWKITWSCCVEVHWVCCLNSMSTMQDHYRTLYGNCWIMARTSDRPPEASTKSAVHSEGSLNTGEGISPVWLEGVRPGSTSPRPYLRADCHWGRISFWRLLPLEFFWEPRKQVSVFIYFWLHLSTMIILVVIWPVKYQPNHTALLIVYLLTVH